MVVFQDLLTKWSLVFQCLTRRQQIAKLFMEEIVLVFVMPETLLSYRGTNLFPHLLKDECSLLRIAKYNAIPFYN